MAYRWPAPIALIGGSLGVAALFTALAMMLPPVVPASSIANAASAPAPAHPHPAPAAATAPVVKPSGPYGFEPIQYGVFQSQLTREAHALHLTLVAPQSSYPNTSLLDSYIEGPLLMLHYNNMLVIESSQPIPSTYRPLSSTAVTLSNGITADWVWSPGGGGPQYRLQFQEQQTYVRLQLYSPQVPGTLSAAEHVAEQFATLG